MFLGEDESGTERIVTQTSKAITTGAHLKITNCSVYIHHGEKQLSTHRFTKILEVLKNEESAKSDS